MTILILNQQTTELLQIGEQLTIDATAGAASIVGTASERDPDAPIAVIGKSMTFGPFDKQQAYRIVNITGTTVTTRIPAGASFEPEYRVIVGPGRERGVTVPQGSTLTVAASPGSSGYLYQRGTFSPLTLYNGAALTIGPFAERRWYRVACLVGSMDVRTGYLADPTPNKALVLGGIPLVLSGAYLTLGAA